MKWSYCFIYLFFAARCYGQKSFPVSTPHTPLWGIINSKGDTSYLYGTFHEFGNSFFDLHPTFKKYKRCKVIVTESIPDDKPNTHIVANWVSKLTRSDRKNLEKCIKELNLGFRLKAIKNLPPSWIEYAIISELYKKECNIWTDKDVVRMDEYISNYGVSHSKKILGLESANDTFNVINTMTGASGNEDTMGRISLMNVVNNEQKYADSMKQLCQEADNYRALNIDYKFNASSVTDDPNFLTFLDKRNATWMPEIVSLIDAGNAFIAVGVKHLFYKNGLIMKLYERSYAIFPITDK